MLLIGTVISMLTAVAATRAMLGLLAGFRWFDNPRFMGATAASTPRWLQIDFMAPALARGSRSRARSSLVSDRLARRPGPEPRHRLQGRHAGQLHDDEARHARAGARRRRRRSDGRTRSSRAAAASDGRRVQELPDPHRSRSRPPSRTARSEASTTSVEATSFGVKNVSVELRPPDRPRRAPRDHRLAAPDRLLHLRSASTGSSRSR